MKKILFAIAIVLTLSFTANAQGNKNDAFVADWGSDNRGWGDATLGILLPTGAIGDNTSDYDTPLGSGLLVLTALGTGYAVTRKNRKQ